MRHILTAEQFTPRELTELFDVATEFKQGDASLEYRQELMRRHFGRIMLSMFYEPSTRTRFSFEIAATKLGIGVSGTENAGEFSSAAKGETIEDTVRVLEKYADAVVLRTKEEGHAERAASAVKDMAVINGGDGKGEHPTQAALDMYTIYEQFNRLDNLNVAIGGDLAHGRTARSLALLLSKYNDNKISFVSTPELGIGGDIKARLNEKDTSFEETADMYEALREADVVYWTRLQLERHKDAPRLSVGQEHFILGEAALRLMKKDAIIMHPLPRNQEIPPSTDDDPRAKYFDQAGNGLYMRMAMLDTIMKTSD